MNADISVPRVFDRPPYYVYAGARLPSTFVQPSPDTVVAIRTADDVPNADSEVWVKPSRPMTNKSTKNLSPKRVAKRRAKNKAAKKSKRK